MADTEIINKWVTEFFIRHKTNPRVSPTNLLSALKFGDSSSSDGSNLKLKKASVLREISDSLVRGDVDEGTLDLLETLEKLLQGSSSVLESHKSAYCWTAVECTVRFMWPSSVSEGLYEDAVERIWTKRIRVLKEGGKSGLVVSGELVKWEEDLRKAVEDAEVYKRIRETNVRYSAVSALNQLLKEQWELLGSSSLESVAQRLLLKRGKGVDKGDGGGVRSSREDPNARSFGEGEKENGEGNAAEEEGQGQEPSLNKGDKTVARELKDYLLRIQREIDPSSTRKVQEPNNAAKITPPQPSSTTRRLQEPSNAANITPPPPQTSRVTVGTSRQVSEFFTSSSRVRPRLPTPEPLNVSPLNKKTKATPKPRRIRKFWTPAEEAVLREGVREHGKAWKHIKNLHPEVFADRTEVDLKDKWRNMLG